eukprot:jgi/Psemu1/35208/gm1.35208_g
MLRQSQNACFEYYMLKSLPNQQSSTHSTWMKAFAFKNPEPTIILQTGTENWFFRCFVELHSLFQSNSVVNQSMINDAYMITKEFSVKFCYQKVSPLEPSKRSLCTGFKRTDLAKIVTSQLLASNKRRKPLCWTNVTFASLYNKSVSKLMPKAGVKLVAKATQPLTILSSIRQMINHFNSKASEEVTYVPDGEHLFVENHNEVDGVVSVVLKREDDLTTHRKNFKWNHCSNYHYPNRNMTKFEQDIMSARDHLCFNNTSCSQHTIPAPCLVERLVYHESCLSLLCSRQLITEATPPPTQSDPFTSISMSLELHVPTTIDTQNLYCPIHMLHIPRYSNSTKEEILDEEAEADITLAKVLRFHIDWKTDLKDYFDIYNTYESIEKMDNGERSQAITSVLTYISSDKYKLRSNGMECDCPILETFFDYLKLKYDFEVPTAIRMEIADDVCHTSELGEIYCDSMMEEQWTDFKRYWNECLQTRHSSVKKSDNNMDHQHQIKHKPRIAITSYIGRDRLRVLNYKSVLHLVEL